MGCHPGITSTSRLVDPVNRGCHPPSPQKYTKLEKVWACRSPYLCSRASCLAQICVTHKQSGCPPVAYMLSASSMGMCRRKRARRRPGLYCSSSSQ
eukprot:2107073-Pyramimonas_sp.AAC.1